MPKLIPISGAAIGLPTLTRRGLLAAAPAFALLPASAAMLAPSLKQQMDDHAAALMKLLTESAPTDLPNVCGAFLLHRDGRWQISAVATQTGFNHGDRCAHFVNNERWEEQ